jgi:hypothetical protein
VSAIHYEEIEKALLFVSEARERVEHAAKVLAETSGERHLVEALAQADEELLGVHGRLMRTAYFGPARERQLALGETEAA